MEKNEQVAKLMAVFFENFTGDIQPARPMMAGHLQQVLKETTYEILEPLVISVAQDGMMLTRNTLLLAARRKKQPPTKPTPIPPVYESLDNPAAVPMPENFREMFNAARSHRG